MIPLAPIAHPFADVFLRGFIVACSVVAGLFFLRFWSSTRDILFLAFAAFFVILGGSGAVAVNVSHPNEGTLWLSLLHLLATLMVLGAILWKNASKH